MSFSHLRRIITFNIIFAATWEVFTYLKTKTIPFKSFLILKPKTTNQRQRTCRRGSGPAGAGLPPGVILCRRGAGAAGGKERTAGHQVCVRYRRGGGRPRGGGFLQKCCGQASKKEDQRDQRDKGDNSADQKNTTYSKI